MLYNMRSLFYYSFVHVLLHSHSLKGEEEPRYVEMTLAGVSINFALMVSLPNSLLAAHR